MGFERNGNAIVTEADRGRETTVVSRQFEPLVPVLEAALTRALDHAERKANKIAGDSLKETFAYVDQTLIDTRQHLDRAVKDAGGELRRAAQDIVNHLDDVIEKRIHSVEEQSLKQLESAVRQTIDGSVAHAREQVEFAIDALARKVLGLLIPASGALTWWRLHTLYASKMSAGKVLAYSWTAVALIGGACALAEYLKRWTGAAGREGFAPAFKAVMADLIPFVFVGLAFTGLLAWSG